MSTALKTLSEFVVLIWYSKNALQPAIKRKEQGFEDCQRVPNINITRGKC